MTKAEVQELQRGLNLFTRKYARGITSLQVDGSFGKATRARVRTVKYLLGYRGSINSTPNREFRERMWHPNDRKYSSASRIALGAKRRVPQRKNAAKLTVIAVVTPGVTRYDGVPVAKWMVPYLQWARQHGWHGNLASG